MRKKWKVFPNYPISQSTLERIEIAKTFIESLSQKGIHYNYCIKHKEVKGCDESRNYYRRFAYYIGDDYCICKNLLLQERSGDKRKFLVIVKDSKQVDLKTLQAQLDLRKLEFLSAQEMNDILDTTPGNVSIFSLQNDEKHQLEVLIDQEILEETQLAFHPLYNGMSLFLAPYDALKFVDTIQYPYQIVDIPEKEKAMQKQKKLA